MITIRKLASLPRKTALRKAAALLQGYEQELRAGSTVDVSYLGELLDLIRTGGETELADRTDLRLIRSADSDALLRICNAGRHRLLRYLGGEPADWDLMPEHHEPEHSGSAGQRRFLPLSVFLEDIRSPFNVGAIFRSAESLCVEEIILSRACPRPDHPRARRSAMGCTDIVPWRVGDLGDIDHRESIFVLELGGTPIGEFVFPAAGTVIIGSEELGASPEARALGDRSAGRVSIPLYGLKGSLNVSAAFAILMHTWCFRLL